MRAGRHSNDRSPVHRLLDRLAALIAISLVAVSGGLLAELNQQAQAQARVDPFTQSATDAG